MSGRRLPRVEDYSRSSTRSSRLATVTRGAEVFDRYDRYGMEIVRKLEGNNVESILSKQKRSKAAARHRYR